MSQFMQEYFYLLLIELAGSFLSYTVVSAGVEITPKFLVVSRTTYLRNLVVLTDIW